MASIYEKYLPKWHPHEKEFVDSTHIIIIINKGIDTIFITTILMCLDAIITELM